MGDGIHAGRSGEARRQAQGEVWIANGDGRDEMLGDKQFLDTRFQHDHRAD